MKISKRLFTRKKKSEVPDNSPYMLTDEELAQVFGGIEPIISSKKMFCAKDCLFTDLWGIKDLSIQIPRAANLMS